MGQKPPRIIKSSAMLALQDLVQRIANSNAPVLVIGETGVGKEVVAELVHEASARSAREMVRINCAALPKDLIEGELFGCAKGAYTGAVADREGLFSAAHGSTIYLDELSEMPVDLQTRLLRVVQDGMVRPVGKTASFAVDVRIIASLNRPPEVLLAEHALREDLYFRLKTISIIVPPLRERKEDIVPLAQAYLDYFCEELKREPMTLSADCQAALKLYTWPGNVREVINEMNRVALLHYASAVEANHLSVVLLPFHSPEGNGKLTLMEQQERAVIVRILRQNGGNKLATAHQLGIGRQTLYNKLKGYGIEVAEYDPLQASRLSAKDSEA